MRPTLDHHDSGTFGPATARPPTMMMSTTTAPAPMSAPAAATLPAFDFEGGKAVETTSDPNLIYKGFVEYTLRSRWIRPEGVAESLARETTMAIPVPTIGIGASSGCDGQILVTDDMLGLFDWTPKFVRRYADLKGGSNRLALVVAKFRSEVLQRLIDEHAFTVETLAYRSGYDDKTIYRYLAGLRPDPARPGYEHAVISPTPAGSVPRMCQASAQANTVANSIPGKGASNSMRICSTRSRFCSATTKGIWCSISARAMRRPTRPKPTCTSSAIHTPPAARTWS